jgi:hypothetical protein
VADSSTETVDPSKPTDNLGQWNLVVGEGSPDYQLRKLVMAWAKDASTGEARYILELDKLHRGSSCGCVCYSCGLSLTAVNAAKQTFIVRPHFRHPEGAEKNDCMVLSARAAALALLQGQQRITLPAKRFGAQVIGLSGKRYEAWVTKPRKVVGIQDVCLRDSVSAILKLEDGREILVRLTGTGALEEDQTRPVIEIAVDDPSLAGLSPADLKSRLHLLVENGVWCSPHWDEFEQTELAQKQAQGQAADELDFPWPESVPELEESPSRESLLHWLAKEILLREKRLMVPDLAYQSSSTGASKILKPAKQLSLTDVRLEKALGAIRPDVWAKYQDPSGSAEQELLVEITVTNTISDGRLERIRSAGIAALEINLAAMGGTLSTSAFTTLLVDEITAKRWIYHPAVQRREQSEGEAHKFRQRLAGETTEGLATIFLHAVERHANCRTAALGTTAWERQLELFYQVAVTVAGQLSAKGYPSATSDELFGRNASLLERLMSIAKNRAVGYRLDSLWGVIDTIMCDQSPASLRWHTLYLTALKVYSPPLSPAHSHKVTEWRSRVKRSLEVEEDTYRRPRKHDAFLGLLFPAMRADLERPLPGDR